MTIYQSTPTSRLYVSIACSAMKKVFNCASCSCQTKTITHILKIMPNEISPEPVLMIQPTRSGKSTVPLTCSVIPDGVTIIVKNTLALGSDQSSKLLSLVMSSIKNVKSYQLDTFKSTTELKCLCEAIIKHTSINSSTSIVCFTSPEILVQTITVQFIQQLV